MVGVVVGAVVFVLLVALVLLCIGAWMRAEEARDTLRQVNKRLAVIEKQLGIERPRPVAVAREAAAPGAPEGAGAEAGPPPAGEETTLEERIALVWLARIGAGLLVVGAAVSLFYGPTGTAGTGRFAGALVCGAAGVAFAEVNRRRARPLFNQVVLGLAVAVLAFAAVASRAVYGLAPSSAALAGSAAVLALGAFLAVRHATEVPLFLGLAGALVAPALAWRDAPPAGAPAFLLLAGGGALALAVARGFRWTLWLVPVGTFGALIPWYVRSFDPSAAGPHHGLAGRALPLAFAAAFSASWLAAYARARRPGHERLGALPFLVVSLLLAHVLAAAVVWDQPPVLAAACAALGAAGALLLLDRDPWALVPPLSLSFLLLLGGVPAKSPAVATFVPLAAWGLVYCWALLRPAGRRTAVVLSGIAGVVFLVVAGELLAPFRPVAFGIVTAVWSALWARVAMVRRAPWLLAATAFVSFCGLAGAAYPLSDRGDPVLLAVTGLWVAVNLGGLVFRIRSQDETPDRVHLATASGTGVAYGLLVLFLAPNEPVLRGALAACVGAAHVGLGAMLLRRAPREGNALQAVAVGLFAAAAMHILPGAYSTLAWAGLATLLVFAGFRRRSRLLRALGLGLFAVTIGRVVVWDVWRRPLQVGVLFAVGALLLLGSWLYARQGGRLAGVLREGSEA